MHPFVLASVTIVIMMSLTWLIYLKTGKASFVDTTWTLLVAVLNLIFIFSPSIFVFKTLLISLLISFWGVRLSFHLLKRSLKHSEDPRYQEMQDNWQGNIKFKMYLVYLFQGGIAFILALPAFFFAKNLTLNLSWLHYLAAFVSLISLIGESVADSQLARFKRTAQPGSFCNQGLWRYTRHPNYFFEWLFWVGIAVYFFPDAGFLPSLIAPAFMFFLLNYFSGVKMTEESMKTRRGQDYLDYLKNTSAFFPMPSKEKAYE